MKRNRIHKSKIYPTQETVNRVVKSLSKTQLDKIARLRKTTWEDDGKTYGPMSEQQIAWAMKLSLPVIQAVK